MNQADEERRGVFLDALTKAGIDGRNLAVECENGALDIKGTVPDEAQRQKIRHVLSTGLYGQAAGFDVDIAKVKPIDSSDGRGRSPITGTSVDSMHESDHQTDPD
jgi:hypothetical protein